MVSGMTDPGKVIGFLDLAGAWDPSLAFVMGGAIAVGIFAFATAPASAPQPSSVARMQLPTSRDIDKRLVHRLRWSSAPAGDWPASAPAPPS